MLLYIHMNTIYMIVYNLYIYIYMQKKNVSESRCMRKISLALKSRIWDGLEWFAARHSHPLKGSTTESDFYNKK